MMENNRQAEKIRHYSLYGDKLTSRIMKDEKTHTHTHTEGERASDQLYTISLASWAEKNYLEVEAD